MSAEIILYVLVFLTAALGMYGFCETVAVRKNANALNKQLKKLHTEDAKRKKSAYRRLANRLNRSEYGKDLENKLKAANMKTGPFEWTLVRAGALIIVTVMLYKLIALGFPYNVTAAYFLVNWGSKQVLKSRASKYAQPIPARLPEVRQTIATRIRAAPSVSQ